MIDEWHDFDYCLEVFLFLLSSVTAWVVEKIACLVMVKWVNSVWIARVLYKLRICVILRSSQIKLENKGLTIAAYVNKYLKG